MIIKIISLYLCTCLKLKKQMGAFQGMWIRFLGSKSWKHHHNMFSRKEIAAGCPRGAEDHSRGNQELSCSKTLLCTARGWERKQIKWNQHRRN